MVNHSTDVLDGVFSALSDATRRGMIARLSAGALAVGELAEPFDMSLPAVLKHVRVLERAGLVSTAKEGRVVRCTLAPDSMRAALAWLEKYETFWTGRLDALGRYLERQENDPWPAPSVRRSRSPSAATTRSRRRKSGRH